MKRSPKVIGSSIQRHWFLDRMPAGKCAVEPAEGVNSSIVIVMARNGTDFGIKIAVCPMLVHGPGQSKIVLPSPARRESPRQHYHGNRGLGFMMAAAPH
jgi:hypothetical protein